MKKMYLAFVIVFLLQIPSWGTGDSTNYLTLKDTVFLKLGAYQEKMFMHKVEKSQTLFSLAKFYGMSIEELYWYNPDLKNKSISPGQPVNIPIPNRAIIRYKTKDFHPSKFVPVCYIVQPGESLYGICTRLFKMPFDTMMRRNGMTDYELKVNQKLFVGWMSIEGIPESYRKYKVSPEWQRSEYLRGQYIKALAYKNEHGEQGVAFWQKDGKSRNDLYALHRKAPINSIVAITNPMTNRTVYAKVIGNVPGTVYKDDVRIVVSARVAELLGARDPRFFVKIRYAK